MDEVSGGNIYERVPGGGENTLTRARPPFEIRRDAHNRMRLVMLRMPAHYHCIYHQLPEGHLGHHIHLPGTNRCQMEETYEEITIPESGIPAISRLEYIRSLNRRGLGASAACRGLFSANPPTTSGPAFFNTLPHTSHSSPANPSTSHASSSNNLCTFMYPLEPSTSRPRAHDHHFPHHSNSVGSGVVNEYGMGRGRGRGRFARLEAEHESDDSDHNNVCIDLSDSTTDDE